jgi:hypothetical protein
MWLLAAKGITRKVLDVCWLYHWAKVHQYFTIYGRLCFYHRSFVPQDDKAKM